MFPENTRESSDDVQSGFWGGCARFLSAACTGEKQVFGGGRSAEQEDGVGSAKFPGLGTGKGILGGLY